MEEQSVTAAEGIALVGIVFAGLTLIKGLIEFSKATTTKRLELFLQMRTRLRQDNDFLQICALLDNNDPKLIDIPTIQKDRFSGFFEELAIMRTSKLINDEVAFYMFGYYAIECMSSEYFWQERDNGKVVALDKGDPMWALFFDFARDMQAYKSSFKFDRSRLRVN